MRHHNLQVTGSVVVNGLGLATTADLNAYTASADAKISTLQAFTSSVGTTNTFTASTNSRLDSIETISASNLSRLSSIETITASNLSRIDSLEQKTGSLATTGSNTFFGTQTFSGSVYIKENLIVQGSSSLQNITASAVDIGTNKIILNVNNPAVRYAGISVYDSGSTNGTGSLFWDSVDNHWLYEHPADSGAPYNSAILISGPKNEGNLGEELDLVSNFIVKAVGGDHISSSAIYDDGTTIGLKSNTEVSGTFRVGAYTSSFAGVVGIGRTSPEFTLDVNGDIALNRTNKLMFAGGVVGDRARSYITGNDNNSIFIYNPSNYPIATFKYTGDVGIGITDPAYTFDINGILHVSKSFADTSNLQIISEGNIAGINLRSSQGGRFSIAQSYISANITSFLTSTGTSNPSVEAIRITNSTGAIAVANNISVNSGNEIRFYRADNTIYTRLYDAGSLGANGFVLDNTNAEGFHFKNNGTTIMRMPSNGNVGIGTTNPIDYTNYRSLHIMGVSSNSSAILYLTNSTSTIRGLFFAEGTANRITIGSQSNHDFTIITNDAEKMRVTTGGYTGIGNTNPQAKLDLGTSYSGGSYRNSFFMYNDNNSGPYYGTKNGFYMDQFGLSNNTTLSFSTAAGAPGTLYLASKNTDINDASSLTPRLVIAGQTGNVGIGITNNVHKLQVQGNLSLSGTGLMRTYYAQSTTPGAQFEIFRFLTDSSNLFATGGVSGILFINAQDTATGGNQISYTFHLQTNGNGTAQANLTQMSYQLRGNQPIQSIGLQNDGVNGAVKVVGSVVGSGVSGCNVWATFVGVAV